jgi:hypothetical protein
VKISHGQGILRGAASARESTSDLQANMSPPLLAADGHADCAYRLVRPVRDLKRTD